MKISFTANEWQTNEEGSVFEIIRDNNEEIIIQVFQINDDLSASPVGLGIGIHKDRIVLEAGFPFDGYVVIK